jgi:hypothetical protein
VLRYVLVPEAVRGPFAFSEGQFAFTEKQGDTDLADQIAISKDLESGMNAEQPMRAQE